MQFYRMSRYPKNKIKIKSSMTTSNYKLETAEYPYHPLVWMYPPCCVDLISLYTTHLKIGYPGHSTIE